jgi:hypothetical protein
VAKPIQPKGRSTRLKANKEAINMPKDTKGRVRKLQTKEELKIFTKKQTQAISTANKTIATISKANTHRFIAINSLSSS